MQEIRSRVIVSYALAIAAFHLTLALGANAQGWKTYRYPADGFSASYPDAPDIQTRNVPTQAGAFELRSYLLQVGTAALYIGACDYGPTAAGMDAQSQLEGAKNGVLANSGSHLLREKKITLGIYPGVEFESESDSAHFTARIYIVGGMLYQTLVVNPIGTPFHDTQRFLDSFQIIARSPGPIL